MVSSGLGSLGLWLELRRKRGGRLHNLRLPPGDGPLLVLRATGPAKAAAREVLQVLEYAQHDLRVLTIGADGLPDIAEDPLAAPQLLAEVSPAAVLLLGDDLPAALIHAASEAGVMTVLAQTQIREKRGWGLEGHLQRSLLSALDMICVTDQASRDAALGMGILSSKVVLTGPVTELLEPLPGFEAERSLLAAMLRGRHVWLACALPAPEEEAVVNAHLAALRHSHRALLIVQPADPARAEAVAQRFEEAGLIVARRWMDEEPTDEVQVQVVEDPQELGLWYRLSPLCFMGGTLSGNDAAARHPFEPAALGAAIVHGLRGMKYKTLWQQLDGAGAARRVRDAEELAAAIVHLSQPQQVASLAANAWGVSTGGAGVALEIAKPVLAHLKKVAA